MHLDTQTPSEQRDEQMACTPTQPDPRHSLPWMDTEPSTSTGPHSSASQSPSWPSSPTEEDSKFGIMKQPEPETEDDEDDYEAQRAKLRAANAGQIDIETVRTRDGTFDWMMSSAVAYPPMPLHPEVAQLAHQAERLGFKLQADPTRQVAGTPQSQLLMQMLERQQRIERLQREQEEAASTYRLASTWGMTSPSIDQQFGPIPMPDFAPPPLPLGLSPIAGPIHPPPLLPIPQPGILFMSDPLGQDLLVDYSSFSGYTDYLQGSSLKNMGVMPASGSEKYECHSCGKSFRRPSGLKDHMNIHSGEKPVIGSDVEEIPAIEVADPTPLEQGGSSILDSFGAVQCGNRGGEVGVGPNPSPTRSLPPSSLTQTADQTSSSLSDSKLLSPTTGTKSISSLLFSSLLNKLPVKWNERHDAAKTVLPTGTSSQDITDDLDDLGPSTAKIPPDRADIPGVEELPPVDPLILERHAYMGLPPSPTLSTGAFDEPTCSSTSAGSRTVTQPPPSDSDPANPPSPVAPSLLILASPLEVNSIRGALPSDQRLISVSPGPTTTTKAPRAIAGGGLLIQTEGRRSANMTMRVQKTLRYYRKVYPGFILTLGDRCWASALPRSTFAYPTLTPTPTSSMRLPLDLPLFIPASLSIGLPFISGSRFGTPLPPITPKRSLFIFSTCLIGQLQGGRIAFMVDEGKAGSPGLEPPKHKMFEPWEVGDCIKRTHGFLSGAASQAGRGLANGGNRKGWRCLDIPITTRQNAVGSPPFRKWHLILRRPSRAKRPKCTSCPDPYFRPLYRRVVTGPQSVKRFSAGFDWEPGGFGGDFNPLEFSALSGFPHNLGLVDGDAAWSGQGPGSELLQGLEMNDSFQFLLDMPGPAPNMLASQPQYHDRGDSAVQQPTNTVPTPVPLSANPQSNPSEAWNAGFVAGWFSARGLEGSLSRPQEYIPEWNAGFVDGCTRASRTMAGPSPSTPQPQPNPTGALTQGAPPTLTNAVNNGTQPLSMTSGLDHLTAPPFPLQTSQGSAVQVLDRQSRGRSGPTIIPAVVRNAVPNGDVSFAVLPPSYLRSLWL
ncbi:unnamed protein product [Rhizoctonia solani]|uniref:C2H2-type domain-containing protein n=1 Tax=Rhizoctonia solani TaxID=456999 RepID=A0A8H3CIK1_9AGAM|nr:unnamed protein product [Rhizoctonia solani]